MSRPKRFFLCSRNPVSVLALTSACFLSSLRYPCSVMAVNECPFPRVFTVLRHHYILRRAEAEGDAMRRDATRPHREAQAFVGPPCFRLASVMEVLANAAVAEICKLVDEGYALLRLEVSRAHKENMALRRRIRALDPRGPEPFRDADNPCADDGKPFPALMVSRAHRKGDLAAEDAGNELAAIEQATCESLLIKEERLEEDSDPSGEQHTDLRPNAEGVAVAVGSVSAKSSPGPGEFTEALRSRHCALEMSALETALKVEPEKNGSNSPLQNAASARGSYINYTAVSRGCNRLRTFFAQGVGEREADDPSCSYVTEMESESLSFHSELPVAQEDEGNCVPLGSPEVKREVVPVEPILEEADPEMQCVWNHNTVSSRTTLLPRRRSRGDGRREREQQDDVFGVQMTKSETSTKIKSAPLNVTGYEPCETSAIPSNDTAAHSKAGRREKVFICTICGKAFNRPKKVEIHLRVHTGEKPFRCMLCGKWFAESGNLKKHQRVHTGEKPFSCAQCGRRFAWIRNLKTHQLRSHM